MAAERRRLNMKALLNQLGDDVAIASITAAELLHGSERAGGQAVRAARLRFVEETLALIPILPFGITEARHLARIWVSLDGQGSAMQPYDYLVAATALSVGFAVASLNRREFERVPGLALHDVTAFVISLR